MTTSGTEWGFLLDENVGRTVATRLRAHGHRAELVVDALEPGVDDRPDIVPYARREDLVIITRDVSDFGDLDRDEHDGVILVFDDALDGEELANGIRRIVDVYPSRDALRGGETLDPWV